MRRSFPPLVASFLIGIALPAAAAEIAEPAFWITPGGGIAWPPAELGFGHNDVDDTAPTFGGIVGVGLTRGFGLEARGHFLSSDDLDLDILHGEGNQFTPEAEAILRDGLAWRLR